MDSKLTLRAARVTPETALGYASEMPHVEA